MNSFDRWRLSLLISLITSLVGGLLLVILAFGAANPPRAGALIWQADSDANWQRRYIDDLATFYEASVAIPSESFTVELAAMNKGDDDSAWGLWIDSEQSLWLALVSQEGYFSVSSMDVVQTGFAPANLVFDWHEFFHIRPQTKISLHVDSQGSATLGFNDEIAWTGEVNFEPDFRWGTVHYKTPELSEQTIHLYAPASGKKCQ